MRVAGSAVSETALPGCRSQETSAHHESGRVPEGRALIDDGEAACPFQEECEVKLRVITTLVVLSLASALLADDGARYLIITADQFEASIRPLAEWKHASGLQCKVVRISEIGTDTAAIHDYIESAYNTWPVRPEFVLLVGHPSAIRAGQYGERMWRFYSDTYYGDVTGDYRAEIKVGRFPARSVAQCDVMVEKTLAYERNPGLADSLWMRRLTTVVREDYDADDSTYWNNVRNAAGLAGAAGFVSCDSLSLARGHSATHVVSSVNRGTGLVLYRGTAGGNWREPFNVEPDMTANGDKLPVVLSITCETMALDPYDSMVGSGWALAGWNGTMHGAVAFFGNTHSASNVARERGAICRGFFTGLFTENRYVLGDALLRAKQQLYTEFPSDDEDYRGFCLFGDPALRLWTETPQPLAVGHAREILPGPQQVGVEVTRAGLPLAGALVCASMDTTIYAFDSTDAAGTVLLDVSPADTGQLRLVVTARDCIPYDALVHVVTQVGLVEERPVPAARPVVACPSTFTGHTVLTLAGPAPSGARVEVRDAAGRAVRSIAAAGCTNVEWDGRAGDGSACRPGVYFCDIRDARDIRLGAVKVTRVE